MLERGPEIRKKWQQIPTDTDILITHCPPNGIFDMEHDGTHTGCSDLLDEIQKRIKPKYHIFGHNHLCHGKLAKEGTTFINCCMVDDELRPMYAPIMFKLPLKQ